MSGNVTSIDMSASMRQVQAVEDVADQLAATVKTLDELIDDAIPNVFSSGELYDEARSKRVCARLGSVTTGVEQAAKQLKTTVKENMEGSIRRYEDLQASTSA